MTNEEVLNSVKHLVGSRYVPSVKAYISELTGRPKVTGVDDISTMECDDNRLNIKGNEAGLIESFWLG